MNVKGIDADGEVSELHVAAQNESMVNITTRFSEAMRKFPSLETENQLIQICQEIEDSPYAKHIRFQCEREIAKSKIERGVYHEAIEYLVKSLKTDSQRTDIWVQLALCAQQTDNVNLFLAANSRLMALRPQLQVDVPPPGLPSLVIPNEKPKFVGYSLQSACWRLFMNALQRGLEDNPYDIPEIMFTAPPIQFGTLHTEWDLDMPLVRMNYQINNSGKQGIVVKLGGYTLPEFFATLVAKERENGNGTWTWTFSEPMILLAGTVVNKIAQFPFVEKCRKDVAMIMIDIAGQYLKDDLTPNARLFLTELASVYKPDMCKHLMMDVSSAHVHSQHALVRISFALLEESIRNNLDYRVLERQMSACKANLSEPLELRHAGVKIDKEMLEKKNKQVQILKMIQTKGATDPETEQLFDDPEQLQFLSLKNVIELFLKFGDEAAKSIFPSFIRGLPDLIRRAPNETDKLLRVFERVTDPMSDDFIQNLHSILKALMEVSAGPELVFGAAIAIARASAEHPERAKKLANIHKILGKLGVCHLKNGLFLEYLLDALIPSADEFESEITAAFSCYFSDVPLSSNSHHSQLQFRCSRFVQPFYEHVVRIDDRGAPQSLFGPYLAIWKHWKSGCGCIHGIDGWRMYKSIKKRQNLLYKTELPEGYTPQGVLEDLLRNDPGHGTESRIALAKVLIRSYVTSSEPEPRCLQEAIALLSEDCTSEPRLKLNAAIAKALQNNQPLETVDTFTNLAPFSQPKLECRRLYWTIRTMLETHQAERARPYAQEALQFFKAQTALPTEFALPLVSIAAEVLQDRHILKQRIDSFPKGKIPSPYPHLILARLSPPDQAFKLVSDLVRANYANIVNFFHFDFRPPFLMARPDDNNQVRHDVLQMFIDSAAASGNYMKLLGLFNPSNKLDQKASKVMTKNRYIYGIDRYDIFEKYTRELTKIAEEKMQKKGLDGPMTERVMDAIIRGQALETTEGLKQALDELFVIAWKDITGKDPTPEATVNELVRIHLDNEDDYDDDEEEDGEFVDDSDEEDNDEQNQGEPETESPTEEGEEEEESANEETN